MSRSIPRPWRPASSTASRCTRRKGISTAAGSPTRSWGRSKARRGRWSGDLLEQVKLRDQLPLGEARGTETMDVDRGRRAVEDHLRHELAESGGMHHPVAGGAV